MAAMDIERLARFVELPETHRQVLGGYSGAYSLGVGQDPAGGHQAVLILQVEQPCETVFPGTVDIAGEWVPLVVRTRFTPPRPLSGTEA